MRKNDKYLGVIHKKMTKIKGTTFIFGGCFTN